MIYNVGDTVPDFEMESTDGSIFRLSEAVKKGPVLDAPLLRKLPVRSGVT